MAFIIENGTVSPLEIEDLGITLEIGETTDLSTRAEPQSVATSMEVGEELYTFISSGDVIVKDPLDGVTNLSSVDGITCLQSINDPHWRVGAGARAQDVAFIPVLDNSEIDVQAAVAENSGKMEWKNLWVATQYDKHDVVRDGDWTMVANKQTTDRAAPQPDGDPEAPLPDLPTFISQSNLSTVEVLHTYTFATSGWLKAIRIWPATIGATYDYRLRITDITNPAQPVTRDYPLDISQLVAGQWNTITTNNVIIIDGSILSFELIIINTSSTTMFTGGWTFDNQAGGNSTPAVPINQAFTANSQWTRVHIDEDDLNSISRVSELLSVTPGSIIQMVETANVNNSVILRVEDDPIDMGTYIRFLTTLIDVGTGGEPTVGQTTTIDFDIPVPSNTNYVEASNIWNNPIPDYLTSVTSTLSYDGVNQSASINTAYGIDFKFQRALISDDWDLIATSEIVGSPGGGTSIDELVKVSANDTVGDYLDSKLVAGVGITLTENNDGANETLTIDSAIITQDEGIVVPNGPHGILNFVGSGVVATDAGGGVTTVTIPGGAGVSNAITTVVGDSGSFTGVGEDTLNILGGAGITTSIVGDILTITATGGAPARVFDVYDNTGGQIFTTTAITINLDTVRKDSGGGDFTLAADELTINVTDTYVITYRIGLTSQGGVRSTARSWLELNSVEVDGSSAYSYNRNTASGQQTAGSAVVVLDLTAGDVLRIRTVRFSGPETLATIADASGLTVYTLASQGPQGPAGTGTTINIEDEGIGVINTPHSTLNFVGAGVVVTDAGAGVATVTIPGGGTGVPGGVDGNVQYNNGGVFGGSSVFNFDDINLEVNIEGNPGDTQLTVGGTARADSGATAATLYVEVMSAGSDIDGMQTYFSRVTPGISGWIANAYDGATPYLRIVDEDDDSPYIRFVTIGAGTEFAPDFENRFGTRNDPVGGIAGATTGFQWLANGADMMYGDVDFLTIPRAGAQNSTPVNGMLFYNTATNKFQGYENGVWEDLVEGAGGSVFGTEYQRAESAGISTTTSTTFQNKVTLVTSSLPAGTYRIHFSYGWNHNANNSDFEAQLLQDAIPLGQLHKQEPKDSGGGDPTGTTQRYYAARTFTRALTAGVHTYDIDWRTDDGVDASSIWEAVIELWRVS